MNVDQCSDNGRERSKVLHRNIIFSGFLKAVGLATSFLIVPMTLDYLSPEPFGIWMTISTMAFWISTFDIGLGNGLRNYLAEAITLGDYDRGRMYVSSTFALLTLIALIIGTVCVPLIMSLDITRILNTTGISNTSLQNVFNLALLLTLVGFVAKNISYIYIAQQKYAVSDLITTIGSVAALCIIYVLTKTTSGNLLYVVVTFLAMPILVCIAGAIPLFRKFPELRPRITSVSRSYGKMVVSKGLGFFFIQVTSCLVIFGGSNLIISHYMGPESVTTYNIAYKYFNLLIIGYTIIIAPMWNAYTEAYVKGDNTWICKTFYHALAMWGLSAVAGVIMLLMCDTFYKLWVGEAVIVPWEVSAAVLTFVTFFNLNNCVTYMLNGIGTIRVQITTSLMATVVYIAFVVSMGSHTGIVGIILAMAICYAVMSLVHLYQCQLIIKRKATGIWNK